MTLLFEFISEVIASIFVEGAYETTFTKNIPLWIRILLLTVIVTFFGVILLGLITLGIFLITQGKYIEGTFMTILGVALTLVASRRLISDFKNRDIT